MLTIRSSCIRHTILGHRRFCYITTRRAHQTDAHAALQTSSVIDVRLIQLKLRFHELVYPTTQGDVGVAKQICIDGVHHTCDLETLALKLLIRRDGVRP